jgi:hypothetical protein
MSLGGTHMRRRRARPSEAPWRCAAGDGRGDRTRGTCRQRYGMGMGTLVVARVGSDMAWAWGRWPDMGTPLAIGA